MAAITETDVRNYISELDITGLNQLITRIKQDFAYPETVEFADVWKLNVASGHEHAISITDHDIKLLKAGKVVEKETWESDNHTHSLSLTYSNGQVSVTTSGNHGHALVSGDGTDVVTNYIAN